MPSYLSGVNVLGPWESEREVVVLTFAAHFVLLLSCVSMKTVATTMQVGLWAGVQSRSETLHAFISLSPQFLRLLDWTGEYIEM